MLHSGGIILIQEALLSDGKPGPLCTTHWLLEMALLKEGRQFHAEELKNILESAAGSLTSRILFLYSSGKISYGLE